MSVESLSKNGTRDGGRASKKKNIRESNKNQVKSTTEICVSIVTRPKEHTSEPLKGNIPKSRQCRQRYSRKREKEKTARSKSASTLTLQTSKTDGAKSRVWSKKR